MDAATTAPEFLLVVNGAEAGRYEKKASANKAASRARAKGTTATAEVRDAATWDAETEALVSGYEEAAAEVQASIARNEAAAEAVCADALAAMEAEEEAHLASEGFVPAGGVEPAEGNDEDAERDGADLAAAEVVEEAEEVTAEAGAKAPARKLTLAERRALSGPVHAAFREALAEVRATIQAGSDPALANVTERDAEACIALWAWYLPNGKQWDDAL